MPIEYHFGVFYMKLQYQTLETAVSFMVFPKRYWNA